MNNADFFLLESMCDTLQRLASQYAEGSDEHSALTAAAAALLNEATRSTREQFSRFSKSSNRVVTEAMLADWVARHPKALVGTTTVIGARLFVVISDVDGQSKLVPVFPINDDVARSERAQLDKEQGTKPQAESPGQHREGP